MLATLYDRLAAVRELRVWAELTCLMRRVWVYLQVFINIQILVQNKPSLELHRLKFYIFLNLFFYNTFFQLNNFMRKLKIFSNHIFQKLLLRNIFFQKMGLKNNFKKKKNSLNLFSDVHFIICLSNSTKNLIFAYTIHSLISVIS